MTKKTITLIFFGLLGFYSHALATTFASTTLEKFVETSTIVVKARVEQVESRWNDSHTRIYTYTTVSVSEAIKGHDVPESIVLKELGGRVGDESLVVNSAAHFNQGEDVILFLIYHRDRYWLHSMAMGKFNVVEENHHKIAVNRDIPNELIKLTSTQMGSQSELHPEYDLNKFVGRIKEFVASED